MKVRHGEGRTQYGPGVSIELTGDEVATAIDAYLVAHGVHVSGPRTVTVNGELCEEGRVYVDPSGFAIHNGEKVSGRGPEEVNVCEHGDHPAPPGKRFCSKACQDCEACLDDPPEGESCMGICGGQGLP